MPKNWWLFGKPRPELRLALTGLNRYIATVVTSKHRVFTFIKTEVLPDDSLIAVAADDAFLLGVVSSRVHLVWALSAGTTLEDRPRYIKTRCFDPFPFPDCTEVQKNTIRDVAERLDAHRKRQQELHPWLTLTGMYNGARKAALRRVLYQRRPQHLRSWTRRHPATAATMSWTPPYWTPTAGALRSPTEQILEKLVELNAQRHAEEAGGLVRWLRPEFQAPNALPTQAAL